MYHERYITTTIIFDAQNRSLNRTIDGDCLSGDIVLTVKASHYR